LLNAIAAEAAAREKGDKDLDTKKVDKREGYSLTKNDFTDILKANLMELRKRQIILRIFLSLSTILVSKLRKR
jgi:hypothetical protein